MIYLCHFNKMSVKYPFAGFSRCIFKHLRHCFVEMNAVLSREGLFDVPRSKASLVEMYISHYGDHTGPALGTTVSARHLKFAMAIALHMKLCILFCVSNVFNII